MEYAFSYNVALNKLKKNIVGKDVDNSPLKHWLIQFNFNANSYLFFW